MDRKVILVTGASRGLGAAIARSLALLGVQVVLTARSADDLEAQAQEINASGGQALAVVGDLSREADCRAIVERAAGWAGRIDGLVHNGGTVEPIAPVAQADPQAWRTNWEVNVLAPVRLTQLALPWLRESRGRVIHITSGSAQNVIGGWGAYSTAKAALNQLNRVLAQEEPEITSLAVRPGIVDTQMQALIRAKGKGRMADRNYQWLSGLYEQGRLLPPDLPGRAIACLALQAPHEWSGEIIDWDDERVGRLIETCFPPGAS